MSYNKNATCRFEKQKIISIDEDEFEMQEVDDDDDNGTGADQEDPYKAHHRSAIQQPRRQKIEMVYHAQGDEQRS